MTTDALGIWYCTLVDQEQSDEEADEYGEYGDYGDSEPQKADRTEYAGTTLELLDDGRYVLKGPQDYQGSHGTWTEEGGSVRLTQADDCVNGYEGLVYAIHCGEQFVVGFKLVPDAHDGLDIVVLTFGRQASVPRSG